MNKILVFVLTMVIAGCGGGSSNNEPKTQEKPTTNESDSTNNRTEFNGLYQSADAVLLVDLNDMNKAVAVENDGTIYSFDSAYTFSNQLRLLGPSMTLVDGTTYYDKNQVVTVYFEGDNANAVAQIHGQSFAHNFTRQPDTDSFAALAGTHTNPDTGETWSIDSAGNITINGMCTISGQLIESAGFYHKASATATGCNDPDFNGDYQGFVFSVTYNGTKVLAGMVYNDNSSMWSYVPL